MLMESNSQQGDPALRAQAAQAYLGIRHSLFYRLIREGRLPQGVCLGRARVWRRSWLDRFLDELGAKSATGAE